MMAAKIPTEVRVFYENFLNDIRYIEGGLLEGQDDQDIDARGK